MSTAFIMPAEKFVGFLCQNLGNLTKKVNYDMTYLYRFGERVLDLDLERDLDLRDLLDFLLLL